MLNNKNVNNISQIFNTEVNNNKLNFNFSRNVNFVSKFILNSGIQLGGHLSLLKLTTTSVVFGSRFSTAVINVNSSFIEIRKVLRIIEGLGNARATIYFINSLLCMSAAFKKSFKYYNKHLFFPFKAQIYSFYNMNQFTKFFRKYRSRFYRFLSRKRFFLLKTGVFLLRKLFVCSKWVYGCLSNARSFSIFVHNVLHENIKIGKFIKTFRAKIRNFFDFIPRPPGYGFIGDHNQNYWIVNEFKKAKVPNSSFIDTLTTKGFFSMYGIPGNGASMDVSFFFLVLLINSYLSGYNSAILKFFYKKSNFITKINFRKEFFFKKFVNI